MNRDRLARLAINEEGFVFDPQTGESFTINQVAHTLLKSINAGDDEAQMVVSLCETYEVTETTARRDVRDFLDSLHGLKLI
ncbi:PqqD family protein [Magnetococcus sp. PR-3]|uniref:PqqD family protein n=1 Tax=Magnetococcus sp. PR-3 TaxID=3120355 RepID=UPI002FCE597A